MIQTLGDRIISIPSEKPCRDVFDISLELRVKETIPDEEIEDIIQGFYEGYTVVSGTAAGNYQIREKGQLVAIVSVTNLSSGPLKVIMITVGRL